MAQSDWILEVPLWLQSGEQTGWSLLEFCEITLIDEMDSRGKMEERGKQRETDRS